MIISVTSLLSTVRMLNIIPSVKICLSINYKLVSSPFSPENIAEGHLEIPVEPWYWAEETSEQQVLLHPDLRTCWTC